jgi:hypothetical protein
LEPFECQTAFFNFFLYLCSQKTKHCAYSSNQPFLDEQMKKIIILANTSWNIHNFRRNILQMLLDAPFEVVVVTPIDAFLSFIQDFPNARHIPLKKLARKSINPLRDIQLANELISVFQNEKPNIILNYTIKPNIVGGGALAS